MYSYVEQVKLYRLVYDSIRTVEKLQEKSSQKVMGPFLTFFRGIFEGVLGRSTLADQQ